MESANEERQRADEIWRNQYAEHRKTCFGLLGAMWHLRRRHRGGMPALRVSAAVSIKPIFAWYDLWVGVTRG